MTNSEHVVLRYALLTLLLLFGLTACAPKTVLRSAPAQQPAALPGHKAHDPAKALEKYKKHIGVGQPADAAHNEVWNKSVTNSIQVGEFDLAETALKKWQEENSNATSSWSWNQANAHLTLARKGQSAYTAQLADLIRRSDLDWTTREAAGLELVEYHWTQKQHGQAFETLGLLYAATQDKATQGALETLALDKADSLSVDTLDTILHSFLGTDPTLYPWSMLIWSGTTRRLQADMSIWPTVSATLTEIVASGHLANQDFFATSLRNMEQGLGAPSSANVALLVPLSGPYAQVGWKIAQGADCAWRERRVQAGSAGVKVINTEGTSMFADLAALPPGTIIGGPLRKEVWERIRQANVHRSARFLTFLPAVEEEGQYAWRFFSSPQDQVRAVLDASDSLGVSSYAVVYPQDRFGTAMNQVFQDEAVRSGKKISTTRSYDINAPQTWTKTVAEVLRTSMGNKAAMNPEPDFQAVFLPDSLSSAQQLVPLFFYYEETRLIVLGPQVWTQNVADAHVEPQYFDLAVFPGTWNDNSTSQSAKKLQQLMTESGGTADAWAALGYDFVRLATMLDGNPNQSSEAFNQALARAGANLSWSMAPIHWDQGKASQDMFVFQPTEHGMTLADLEQMRQTRETRQQRREQRRQQLQPSKQ